MTVIKSAATHWLLTSILSETKISVIINHRDLELSPQHNFIYIDQPLQLCKWRPFLLPPLFYVLDLLGSLFHSSYHRPSLWKSPSRVTCASTQLAGYAKNAKS